MRNMTDYAVVVGRMRGEAENRMVQHNLRPVGSGVDIRAGYLTANDEKVWCSPYSKLQLYTVALYFLSYVSVQSIIQDVL